MEARAKCGSRKVGIRSLETICPLQKRDILTGNLWRMSFTAGRHKETLGKSQKNKQKKKQ